MDALCPPLTKHVKT